MVICLNNGLSCIVDDEDFDKVSRHTWYCQKSGKNRYAASRTNGKFVYMHKIIMHCNLIDHINGNGLDNRKCNLRSSNKSLNSVNSQKRDGNNTSKFKGVSFRVDRNRWRSVVTKDKKTYFLGHFFTELDAAKAYNTKVLELFGQNAVLNIIN